MKNNSLPHQKFVNNINIKHKEIMLERQLTKQEHVLLQFNIELFWLKCAKYALSSYGIFIGHA